jgi:hypothetical protein
LARYTLRNAGNGAFIFRILDTGGQYM